MSKARILSLVPYKILPAVLGGEKGIAIFNDYLSKDNDLLAVSTTNNKIPETLNYRMLNTLSTKKFKYANPLLFFYFKRLIKQYKPTHFMIEHPYFGWLAWLIKKTTPIVWVTHSHNIEFQRSRSIGRWWWKALKWYEKWVYNATDIIFFISDDDRNEAVNELNILPDKAHTVTYGIEIARIPEDRAQCRAEIMQRHNIAPDEQILLFNGSLYHSSNYSAVEVIINNINPTLLDKNIPYKIIICGKGLPDFFNELAGYKDKNIIFAGFVEDISLYFKATDIFLNPIISGGGIKTKAVEALSYNCSVVSTEIGALGIVREVCGNKLSVVKDNDWISFSSQVMQMLSDGNREISGSFYDYYYWGNIINKVNKVLAQTMPGITDRQ